MELVVNRKNVAHTISFDESDKDLVMRFKWNIQLNKTGVLYARGSEIGNMKNRVYMHRILMSPLLRSDIIDHADGNGLNNQRINLRKCTKKQNSYNSKPSKGRELRGVEFYKGRWTARMSWEGIRLTFGRFDSKEEAASAYDKVASQLHGDFARLNIKKAS